MARIHAHSSGTNLVSLTFKHIDVHSVYKETGGNMSINRGLCKALTAAACIVVPTAAVNVAPAYAQDQFTLVNGNMADGWHCLTASQGLLYQASCEGTSPQKFYLDYRNDYFTIVHVASGQCVTVTNGQPILSECSGEQSQRWSRQRVRGNWYRWYSGTFDNVLGVYNDSGQNWARVNTGPYRGTLSQMWCPTGGNVMPICVQ
ncbi:RICIN domain-containing protein [Sorangium sp. So ce233]|uniref:RICIN domain-containing protein n=1 Tax=Sorangium sp. So ce233 TaxID=3133290 RepID=UPI003F6173EA